MRLTEAADYLREVRLAVVSTLGPDGGPQAAVVGVGASDLLEVVFDTTRGTRKHANLLRHPRAALTAFGPGERTLQLEGVAAPVPVSGRAGERLRETYYASWPDGRERLSWPDLAYWCITPTWARFTDYGWSPAAVQIIG